MQNTGRTPADYTKLKEELEKQKWPRPYMFKFIVPNSQESIKQVSMLFVNPKAKITTHVSKTEKYCSITIVEAMKNPESVINRYKQAEGIPNLMSL